MLRATGRSSTLRGATARAAARRARSTHRSPLAVTHIDSWIREHAASFAPPVMNKLMHRDQLSIMFVGGPNEREDFHLEEGSEFVYTADPRLGVLAFNPKAWPVIMELTRGQPMIRLGSGINNAPYSGEGPAGGGPLCAPLLPPTPHAPPTHH